MIAVLRLNCRSSLQIQKIENRWLLAHDDRVLIFGEIGDQLFQGNRGMPKNCRRRNGLNLETRLLLVPYLLATVHLALCLHAQVLPSSGNKAIREPTNSAGKESLNDTKIELKTKSGPTGPLFDGNKVRGFTWSCPSSFL